MHVEHHPLIHDFPQLREKLHILRQSDAGFARLATEYESLDKQICRAEDGIDLLNDNELLALKQRRVSLKDQVANALGASSKTCCGGCGG